MSGFKRTAIAVTTAIGFFPAVAVEAQVDRAAILRFVGERLTLHKEQREAAIARARELGLPVRQRLADGKVLAIKRLEHGELIYYTTDNENGADTISSDELWSGGSLGLNLEGTGQTLGIWDGGRVRDTHQELTGRVTNSESASVPLENHSTHVGGTMIASGVSAGARGMSGGAMLRSWDFINDEVEMAAEQLATTPVSVSNHSYSFISGWTAKDPSCLNLPRWWGNTSISVTEDYKFGFYDTSSMDWDAIAADSPNYVVVKSAGNDRNDTGPASGAWHCHWTGTSLVFSTDSALHQADNADGGYDTIAGGSASAKNVITVGSVLDIPGGYAAPTDVVLNSFSGAGPTDDGRIKPDIVANGNSLYSSLASADSAYGNYSGTSMSSPGVSGSVGLLNQHAENLHGSGFRFRSSTMKGLVLHTADEAGLDPGPDYMHGWGLMNTKRAAEVMSADANLGLPDHIRELQLNNGETETVLIYSDGLGPLKITIAWIDPPGTPPPPSLDPTTPMLVNDLDLRVSDPGDTTLLPWVLDPTNPGNAATTGDNFRDNLEQVLVPAPATGLYIVTVAHKGTLKDGAPQLFSLIVTGDVALPSDLDGDLMLNTFEVEYGLDPLDPSDAALDPDGDGVDNLGEFQQDTDPGDSDTDDDGVRDGLDPFPALSQGSDDNYCESTADATRGEVSGQIVSSSQILICADPDGVDVGGDPVSQVEILSTGELRIITPGTTEFRPAGVRVAPGGRVRLYTEPLP